jgi:hypothetical protein
MINLVGGTRPTDRSRRIFIVHNTHDNPTQQGMITDFGSSNSGSGATESMWFNNVHSHGGYGFRSNNSNENQSANIGEFLPAGSPVAWNKNLILNPAQYASYPATAITASGNYTSQFVNAANGDFTLAPNSPGKSAALDGGDIGIDMATLGVATAGVVSGAGGPNPSPTPTPPPTPTPSPTPAPTPTPSPTPSPAPGETIWVEDGLPAGATVPGISDPWNWVSGSPGPFSGALASQSTLRPGTHQNYFTGATTTLNVNTGDRLVAHVFIDPTNVPSQIMLQWSDGDWEQRAYWGANDISFGTDNTNSRRRMGPLPAVGQWVRLEVPASDIGLENKVIDGFAFTLHNGRATFDRVGKTSQAAPGPSPTPTPTPAPIVQLGESILIAKRDGQSLSNQIASSGGSSAPASALVMTPSETQSLQLFVAQIQTAFTQFNNNPGIFPAAPRMAVTLNAALQAALLARGASVLNNVPDVRIHLREAINQLELTGVLIAHPNVTNPIDVASFVVRQHYVDFLDREPEPSGSDFWVSQFASCGTNTQCFEEKRINVSAAFFLSIEFQGTGYFVHRLYRSSYRRVPLVAEFMPDNAVVGRGVIVGLAGWQARLAANQEQFLQTWVQRAEFTARYGSLNNQQYVDALIANLGVAISSEIRAGLILDLANGSTRAEVLGRLVQNEDFSRSEFNRAFVLMQYFGYLRRDPDTLGFNFWLDKLNEFDGNYQSAEMVKAFLASIEYRDRFAF